MDGGPRRSQKTVQLVYRPVSLNAHPVFGNALAAYQASLAGITLARVHTIDRQTGLVERLLHRDLAMVHFKPATKFSFNEGYPNTSSYWRFSALRRFP